MILTHAIVVLKLCNIFILLPKDTLFSCDVTIHMTCKGRPAGVKKVSVGEFILITGLVL